jgi:hypothetical protein
MLDLQATTLPRPFNVTLCRPYSKDMISWHVLKLVSLITSLSGTWLIVLIIGSGKTAAFLIPILSKLMGKAKKLCAPRPNPASFNADVNRGQFVRAEPLVLIVCPTRELASQIFDEARRFCYRTMLRPCVVYGGGPIVEQLNQIAKGCDVLIGTPGRLCDFIDRPQHLSLHRLRYMVIDEADEMVGNDWESELKKIMTGGSKLFTNKYMILTNDGSQIRRLVTSNT